MLFNSYEFVFLFLPVELAGCFLLARWVGPNAAQLWLTGASFYFYGSWNLRCSSPGCGTARATNTWCSACCTACI